MTASLVTFQAGDQYQATVQLSALAPGSTDKVVVWQQSNQVFVAKILTP